MSQGLLRIKGTIDIRQFWPEGQSDADTVAVMANPNGFEFTSDLKHHKSFKVTHVFDDAVVQGKERNPVLHNGKIKIRLEHLDAAELHYRAPVRGSEDYRQYFGETATTKLHDLLATSKQQPIPCEVRTAVNHPNEVCDTYGRVIGNIFVHLDGKEVNVNLWFIENGWAFPSIYNSASIDELKAALQCAQQAKEAKKGVWACLSENVGIANFSLLFRPKGAPDPEHDIGPVVIPKIFRRQVLWHVSEPNLMFREFLATQKEDGWVRMSDFLKDPHIQPAVHDFSTLVDAAGMFLAAPEDLVFFEKPSTLVDAHDHKITSWTKAPAKVRAPHVKPPKVAA